MQLLYNKNLNSRKEFPFMSISTPPHPIPPKILGKHWLPENQNPFLTIVLFRMEMFTVNP